MEIYNWKWKSCPFYQFDKTLDSKFHSEELTFFQHRSTDDSLASRTDSTTRNSKRNECSRIIIPRDTQREAERKNVRKGELKRWRENERKSIEKEEKKGKEKFATVRFPICFTRLLCSPARRRRSKHTRTNARTPTKRQPPGSKSPVKSWHC